jgi:orotate phosphoribosyltransferase
MEVKDLGEILDEIIANIIFKCLEFSPSKIKHHEKDAATPVAPFYFNLRTPGHPKKPGLLTKEDCDLIARCVIETFEVHHKIDFDFIAGIPKVGDSFVDAIQNILTIEPGYIKKKFDIVRLGKIKKNGKRKVVPNKEYAEYCRGKKGLLLDDVISYGDSKIEAAKAVESCKAIVAGMIVLVDIGLGGIQMLQNAGYKIYPIFTAKSLFDSYLHCEKIRKKEYEEAINYINKGG